MTFVQPHKNNITAINITIFAMIAVIAAISASGMFLYNQLVNLRHDLISGKNNAGRAEVENAELKNNLYRMVDLKNFAVTANSHSLLEDKNPEYLRAFSQISSR